MFGIVGYFEWLLNKINCKEYNITNYNRLLFLLYSLDYIWTVPFDENRAVDGKYLRLYYSSETNRRISDSDYDQPCSILEMLIAFAEKADSYLYIENSTYKMFWLMLDNLGLTDMTDDNFDEEEALHVLNGWLNHWGKNSGPFPMLRADNNKGDGIWMEFNRYISERDNLGLEIYNI